MSNVVPRPHVTDPDGTHDSRYLIIGDPRARGPEGPEGKQGVPGPEGPRGPRGYEGSATTIRWTVSSALDLPASNVSVGDGALVGEVGNYTLFVYTNDPSPAWEIVGPVTAGPQGEPGEQGPPGPPGPPPTLAGSGTSENAARSDHHHDGIYSPVTHTHDASSIVSGLLSDNRIPELSTSKITSGVFPLARIPDIPVGKLLGTIDTAQIPTMDASKIATGTLAVDRIPGLPADKITSGQLPASRIAGLDASKIVSGTMNVNRIPGMNANKITAGTLAKDRIPRLSINELFPSNVTTKPGSSAMRVAPGNVHSVLGTLGAGWGIHDTGMRQTTDEPWAYVMVPGYGFCWVPANRI